VIILWGLAVYLAVAEPRVFNLLLLLTLPASAVFWLMAGGRRAAPQHPGRAGLAQAGQVARQSWATFLDRAQAAGLAAWQWARDRLPGVLPRSRRQDGHRRGGPRLTASRLLARLFDYTLFGLLLMLLALGLGRWGFVDIWFPGKLALLAVPWLAVWTALVGATPGKLLLRLRVRDVEAGRVTLAAAMQREWECLRSGVVLAVASAGAWLGKSALVSLFGFRNVWDRRASTQVVQHLAEDAWPGWLRWTAAWGRTAVLAEVGWLFWLGLKPEPDALRQAMDGVTGWLGRLASAALRLAG